MHVSRISVCVVPFAVPPEGGEGHHCVAHLCDGVPVLPAPGWPVLQLLPLPETGDYRHTTHTLSALKTPADFEVMFCGCKYCALPGEMYTLKTH